MVDERRRKSAEPCRDLSYSFRKEWARLTWRQCERERKDKNSLQSSKLLSIAIIVPLLLSQRLRLSSSLTSRSSTPIIFGNPPCQSAKPELQHHLQVHPLLFFFDTIHERQTDILKHVLKYGEEKEQEGKGTGKAAVGLRTQKVQSTEEEILRNGPSSSSINFSDRLD